MTFGSIVLLNVNGPSRYLMPIFPFFVLCVARAIAPFKEKKLHTVILIFLSILLPFRVYGFFKTAFTAAPDPRVTISAPSLKYDAALEQISSTSQEELILSNDSALAYRAFFHKNKVIYPLQYTITGVDELLVTSEKKSTIILWNKEEKGLPIFDTDTRRVRQYEYDFGGLKKALETRPDINIVIY